MKYLFILGRNPKLSVAEVFAYLKRNRILVNEHYLIKNALLVDVNETIEAGAVEDLGGVISIGVVLSSGSVKEIISEIDKKEIYFGESNKLNYVIWEFCEEAEDIRDYLKQRFKQEKLKATEKKLSGNIQSQEGETFEGVNSKNIQEQYFVFEVPAKETYFGKIVQSCNYSEIEKRDMQKPVRRQELAISPRLAKIMINLSEIPELGILVDCFCGIGVILEEALLQNLKVIGVDRNKEAIKGAKENLNWFKFPENNYKLINEDSRRVQLRDYPDVLVSEPDLGLTLKKIPTKENAKIQLDKFEDLIVSVLNNLKNRIKGKIVLSSPLIQTFSKRVGCDIDRILDKTGLRLAKGFPIDEYRESQIVGRRIIVLQK